MPRKALSRMPFGSWPQVKSYTTPPREFVDLWGRRRGGLAKGDGMRLLQKWTTITKHIRINKHPPENLSPPFVHHPFSFCGTWALQRHHLPSRCRYCPRGLSSGQAYLLAGSIRTLGWLSHPFRPFCVSRFAVLPFWHYACYFMCPVSVLPFKPTQRCKNPVFHFEGHAKIRTVRSCARGLAQTHLKECAAT